MIYCVCRQINTAKVDSAAACGARTARCVLAHYGQTFNCGKCACAIQDRLDSKTQAVNHAAPCAPAALQAAE